MEKVHISSQFDADLELVRSRLLQMGGMVEEQLRNAIAVYTGADRKLADQIRTVEESINMLEIELDERCTHLIARRQPTAGDLRLIMAVIKITTDLERIGDEAAKIGRVCAQMHDQGLVRMFGFSDIHVCANMAIGMLKDSLDAFARMDSVAAERIVKQDQLIDNEFRSILRELITFMMEDPRTISTALGVVWIAKALERVGDHAKNIGEYVIYVAEGTDVRHSTSAAGSVL